MKILVIGPSDTKSRGGMATVIRDLRNSEILNREFEIDVFPSYIDGSLPVRLGYSLLAYWKFLAVYRRYDLFHIHASSNNSTFRKRWYLKAIKRAGKKAIVHVHAGQYLMRYVGLPTKKKKKVAEFIHSADQVLCLSQQWKQEFVQVFPGICAHCLYNGVKTQPFRDAFSEPELTRNGFLFLGNVSKDKGVYDLLDAMEIAVRRMPGIVLLIAGTGDTEIVRQLAIQKDLEKNIQLLGWVGSDKKQEYLKQVSTVVLPSYHEALPMSILEGMAAGKAIISTTVGAITEVVTEENGILIPPGDVQALSDALIRCSSDPELLKKMSVSNIRRAEETFSLECMHRQLLQYYREVMK